MRRLKSFLIKTSLRQLAEQGHLPTFKPRTEGITGTGTGSFVSAATGFPMTIAFSATESFFASVGSGWYVFFFHLRKEGLGRRDFGDFDLSRFDGEFGSTHFFASDLGNLLCGSKLGQAIHCGGYYGQLIVRSQGL